MIRRYAAWLVSFLFLMQFPCQLMAAAGRDPSAYEILAMTLPNEAFSPDHTKQMNFEKKGDYRSIMQPKLSHGERMATVLQLFYDAEMHNPLLAKKESPVVGNVERRDLEIFSKGDLFSKINKTRSVFGEVALGAMLAKPTDDLEELKKRQGIIKWLLVDPRLFDGLDKTLEAVHKSEEAFLPFFLSQYYGRQQLAARFYFPRGEAHIPLAGEEILKATGPIYDRLDRSPNALLAFSAFDRSLGQLNTIFTMVLSSSLGLIPFLKTSARTLMHPITASRVAASALKSSAVTAAVLAVSWAARTNRFCTNAQYRQGVLWNVPEGRRTLVYTGASLLALASAWVHFGRNIDLAIKPHIYFGNFFKDWKTTRAVQNSLQEDLIRLARTIDGLKIVNHLLTSRPGLIKAVPELSVISRLFAYQKDKKGNANTHIPQNVRRLIDILQSRTFKGKVSFFSNPGNIFAANRLMVDTRYFWVKVFKALGKLDAYLSVAKLMKEFKDKRVRYCFAEFSEHPAPVISLRGFWNPLVDPEEVVTNAIDLGGDYARNMILTGPNTGGKSTISKGVAHSLILAQCFGIVPAESGTLTPFSKIIVYSDVSDDVKRGLSLFAAEVAQAKRMVDTIQSLPDGKLAFSFIDEMFRGTAPEQAEELSYWYAQELAKAGNAASIHATHYPRLIGLEANTGGLYQNGKVEITRHADGILERHFTLEKGSTTHNIARDILKEQGLMVDHQ